MTIKHIQRRVVHKRMVSEEISRDNSIGKLLLTSKRISETDIEKVIELQRATGLYFGEAAVKLGLTCKEDVDMAIARQFAYPYLNKAENTISEEVIAAYTPFTQKVEAIRSVRTALLLSGVGQELKSVCITGCGKKSGKTFLAANLAVLFAQLGKKTLLVDFNLRMPKLHKLFRVKNSRGVSTMLIRRSLLEEVIQSTAFETLDILPSGPLPPNPLELIARKEARQLIDTLKVSYEVIIVTTPSFEDTGDASFIASLMDAAILVILKGKIRRNILWKAKNILEKRTQLLGTIINQKV